MDGEVVQCLAFASSIWRLQLADGCRGNDAGIFPQDPCRPDVGLGLQGRVHCPGLVGAVHIFRGRGIKRCVGMGRLGSIVQVPQYDIHIPRFLAVVLQWPSYTAAYGVVMVATLSSATLQLLVHRTLWGNVFLTILW